ncbi:MAG: hypothetical protein AB1599_05860 [Planctomycetota bacterium]
MDKSAFLSHIRIYIPGYNEYPLYKARRWTEKYEQGLRHTYSQQRKAIPNQNAFFEKIAQPNLDWYRMFTKPEFKHLVSQRDRTWDDIYYIMENKLRQPKTAHKYLKNTRKAYKDEVRAGLLKDYLPYAAAYYAIEMTFGAWRYLGSINESGEGAFVLASEWLTGRMDCLNFFRDQDERLQGHPALITAPERASEFRKALRNKLSQSVTMIDVFNYGQDRVRKENDRINEFVNGFLKTEMKPFKTDGESHINFTVLPETSKLRRGPELNQVRYRICREFLDETIAQRQLIPPDYLNKLVPEFIHTLVGSPEYPLCVDMRLDIKVSLT